MQFAIGALHVKGWPDNRFNQIQNQLQKCRNPQQIFQRITAFYRCVLNMRKKLLVLDWGQPSSTKNNHACHRRGVSKKRNRQRITAPPLIYTYIQGPGSRCFAAVDPSILVSYTYLRGWDPYNRLRAAIRSNLPQELSKSI